MKLLDLGLAVNGRLRSLPYDTYLKVMYGLLDRYRTVYRELLWPEPDALLIATAALVRDHASGASQVLARWVVLIEDDPPGLDGGLLNLFYVGDFLCGELAGEYPHYAAVEAATLPIVNHLSVHPLRLLDSTEWQGHPGAGLVELLKDVANLDDEKQRRVAVAPFDEAGRIIFG